jgi:hypothetical protein
VYGGAVHFRRDIGVEIRGVYDGVLYWMCPDCQKAWQRWTSNDHQFKIAQQYIDLVNSESRDLLDPILAYLDEHPFTGEPQPSGVATFVKDSAGVTTLVSVVPDLLEISTELLGPSSYLDPGMVTFADGVLTLYVEPAPLHYRPLRQVDFAHAVQFERIDGPTRDCLTNLPAAAFDEIQASRDEPPQGNELTRQAVDRHGALFSDNTLVRTEETFSDGSSDV